MIKWIQRRIKDSPRPPPPQKKNKKKKKDGKKEKKKKKEKMFWAKWNIFISILGQNSVTFYLVICLKKYFIFWLDDKKPEIEKCDIH